jgi:hypothetical protein
MKKEWQRKQRLSWKMAGNKAIIRPGIRQESGRE